MQTTRTASRLRRKHVAWGIILAGVACLPFADLTIETQAPLRTVSNILGGFVPPAFGSIDNWTSAVLQTLAFAIIGVTAGAVVGFLFAPVYRNPVVRGVAVSVRAIHEIFWALLLIHVTGLSVQTGILAIAVPYAGIFAKVFSEYLDDTDDAPENWLHPTTGIVSRFLFTRLPQALPQLRTYLFYRYECGLRSSAVLGFIGLPTLGFQLDSFFRQGYFHEAAAILVAYYVVIATMPVWMRWRMLPAYIIASFMILAWIEMPPTQSGLLFRFLTEDIVPSPLRDASLLESQTWNDVLSWLGQILSSQALPGVLATLIVAQLALVLTSIVAMTAFPAAMPRFAGRFGAIAGHVGLVILRTSPEYMLVYIFVMALGPSMLPAVLALGLHNGAIIAHLLARQGTVLADNLRPDAPRGVNLYGFEFLPRLSGSMLALILYRWEIIFRESAIVGIIGITTLGFYIDSGIAEFKLDVVVVLLIVTMLATLFIDALSQFIRVSLAPKSLSTSPVVDNLVASDRGREADSR